MPLEPGLEVISLYIRVTNGFELFSSSPCFSWRGNYLASLIFRIYYYRDGFIQSLNYEMDWLVPENG